MAWISLEGMRFHAFHGVYDAEKQLGTEFIVDVFVKMPLAQGDNLEATINCEYWNSSSMDITSVRKANS